MPPIATIQPAAPPTPPTTSPAAPPASDESKQFSRHFEKAISRQKEASTRESADNKPPEKSKGETETPAVTADKPGQESAPASRPDQDAANKDSDTPVAKEPAGSKESVAELVAALSGKEGSADLLVVPPAAAKDSVATGEGEPPVSAKIATAMAAAQTPQVETSASPATGAQATLPQNGQKPAADTLLAQLQQIIENSDEQGTVTIKSAKAAPAAWPNQLHVAATPDISDPSTESVQVIPAGGLTPSSEQSEQGAPLRENLQQQYFEAKINLNTSDKKEDSTAQDRQQGSESTAQPQVAAPGQAASTATSAVGDQSTTFAHSLATAQTANGGHRVTETGQAMTLPSGTVVHDGDVLQQVLERFHLAKKPLDTQINIKLHPAELGELKIDLTLKEGAIRANVVAQSQHAQEIIERNMPKLRTVLEDQGFTIDTITVSSKQDSNTDAGLFDRQFFSQSDYAPQAKRSRREAEAAFRLDEAFVPPQQSTTGVNVKI